MNKEEGTTILFVADWEKFKTAFDEELHWKVPLESFVLNTTQEDGGHLVEFQNEDEELQWIIMGWNLSREKRRPKMNQDRPQTAGVASELWTFDEKTSTWIMGTPDLGCGVYEAEEGRWSGYVVTTLCGTTKLGLLKDRDTAMKQAVKIFRMNT